MTTAPPVSLSPIWAFTLPVPPMTTLESSYETMFRSPCDRTETSSKPSAPTTRLERPVAIEAPSSVTAARVPPAGTLGPPPVAPSPSASSSPWASSPTLTKWSSNPLIAMLDRRPAARVRRKTSSRAAHQQRSVRVLELPGIRELGRPCACRPRRRRLLRCEAAGGRRGRCVPPGQGATCPAPLG
jgi:hypothetical protein